jgi:hypothetical protein
MKIEPYLEFLAEREELLKHKWLLSERQQADVGFEVALVDWALNHRPEWRQRRNQMAGIGSKPTKA